MGTHEVTETPRHSVSVAAAIFDESGENVLLIQRRDNGHWEPPGGVLELDETIEDGLRREVREETGAEIEVGPLTGVYKNMTQGIVALVFACTRTEEQVLRSSTVEAAEIRWCRVAELDGLMAPAFSQRIFDAKDSQRACIRSHDGQQLLPNHT